MSTAQTLIWSLMVMTTCAGLYLRAELERREQAREVRK